MNASFRVGVSGFKQRTNKCDLSQRFTARCGNAAFTVKGSVAVVECEYVRHALLVSNAKLPRIGVMTVGAAHGAALHENHQARAGAVNRAERLNGMNPPTHGERVLSCRLFAWIVWGMLRFRHERNGSLAWKILQCLVEGAGNNVVLLLFGKRVELYGIS